MPHPSLSLAATRLPTLDDASLARHGGPLLAELLAAHPDSFLTDSTTIGRLIRADIAANRDSYLNTLASQMPRFRYDEYLCTVLVCRLSMAALILNPSSALYTPTTGGVAP